MSGALLTQEVGSLAKPNWRVAAIAGREITREHIRTAADWADRLDLDPIETEDILCQARHYVRQDGALRSEDRIAIKLLAAQQAVRLQEKAGIDILYDGEQDRSEMYQYAVERTKGFERRGRVRNFDNKSYLKFACVDEPTITEPWHTAEVTRLRTLTDRQIKVPITGAYTIADWSFDEHYDNRRSFVLDVAREVIRPNIQALLAQGVDWIQIDEPAATTKPDEVDLFVESFNESTRDLIGKFSVHICFPTSYEKLLPEVAKLEGCHQFSLEFANHDSNELGTDEQYRSAYKILGQLAAACPEAGFGLGVVSVHENLVESPKLIRDRILRAVDIVGDPTKINPSPDCGLRTRSWDVAYDKLAAVVEGTALAREHLSIGRN